MLHLQTSQNGRRATFKKNMSVGPDDRTGERALQKPLKEKHRSLGPDYRTGFNNRDQGHCSRSGLSTDRNLSVSMLEVPPR